jgi:4-amino-4-deoxy-L-arabinose transferase-like glycosyltransferase
MTFSLLGALIWLGYCALQTGNPPRIAANAARLEPGFVSQFAWLPLIAATVITLAWIALILKGARSPQRSVAFWAAGLALFWGLTMLLWLPWIDYGKSYRKVAQALQATLPNHPGCIASQGLGEAQRAAFDYHADIVTERTEIGAGDDCRLLLIQDNAGQREPGPAGRSKKLWEGNRAGDRSEKFRLYAKEKTAP